jgi:ELWxxDGT repeat protein
MYQTVITRLILALALLSLITTTGNAVPQKADFPEPNEPQMLGNFTTANYGSYPGQMFPFGNLLLFSADAYLYDPGLPINYNDREPWVTNGTEAGTKLLKNIHASGSSQPRFLLASGGKAYFAATSEETGRELWVTDGTPAGTTIVADLSPGPDSSDPVEVVEAGSYVYFVNQRNRQLYRTNGTEAETQVVGPVTADNYGLGIYNGRVYFIARSNHCEKNELWRTTADGTSTEQVKILEECTWFSATQSYPHFAVVGNFLYFIATVEEYDQLWRTDGTDSGTKMIKEFSGAHNTIRDLTAAGDWLYFTVKDPTTGRELWRSNGSTDGTAILQDLSTTNKNEGPRYLTAVGNNLFFEYIPNVYGTASEIWKVDGGNGSLVKIKHNSLLPAFSLNEMGGSLYFCAEDLDPSEAALWRSDGTPETTTRLGECWGEVTRWKNGLAFAGFDEQHEREIWFSDGTVEGTKFQVDVNKQQKSTSFLGGAFYKGKFLFSVNDKLWISNGTEEGTQLLANITAGDLSPHYMIHPVTYKYNHITSAELNGLFYFSAADAAHGNELWHTDGTPAGTKIVIDATPGSQGTDFKAPVRAGNYLYMVGRKNHRTKEQAIWRSDGTPAGTVPILSYGYGDNPGKIEVLHDRAIISISRDYGETDFYRSKDDGTLENFATLPSYGAIFVSTPLLGKLYFAGVSNWIYVMDGNDIKTVTKEGTNSPISGVIEMAAVGNILYFSGRCGFEGGLWKLAAGTTEATLVKEVDSWGRMNLRNLDGKNVLFTIYDSIDPWGSSGILWRSDGTPGGTQRVCPSCTHNVGSYATVWQGKLYFDANDDTHGKELWVTDGTEAGTKLFKDIRQGIGSSNPSVLVSDGSMMFFSADDGIHGGEPWGVTIDVKHYIYLPMTQR